MSIKGYKQKEIIQINSNLRLRKFDNNFNFALEWYQDVETVYLVDGIRKPYDMSKLERMYSYLNNCGELYFIEVLNNGNYLPIGDVTFWQYDMPIVIGNPLYRGLGIAKLVIKSLINRALELGFDKIYVNEIYKYNIASQKAFESVGFYKYRETTNGYSFCYNLKDKQ